MQSAAQTLPWTGSRHDADAGAQLQIVIARALERLQARDTAGMRAILAGAAELATANESASYVFGLFYFNSGDPNMALLWFDRSLVLNPQSQQALAGRGIVLHQTGRAQEALAAFGELTRRAPRDAQALHMYGVVLQGLGRLQEAITAYDGAIAADPGLCDSLINRGVILDMMGRLDEALAAFDAVAELRPSDSTNLFNRGSVLQRLGRPHEALAAYDAARQCGEPNAEIDVNCGNVLQTLGRFGEALACYDAALRLRPNYPQAHYNRGLALQRMRQPEAALAAYDAAIAAKPGYPEAYCNRGNVLAELGQPGEALASFAAALELKPGFPPALINRANILFEQGRIDAALAACTEILEILPDHAQALCIQGAALQRLERHDEALASLERALAVRPDYPEAWLNHGNVLQEQGQLEAALDSYGRALALRPDHAEALSGAGVALKELGRFDEALAAFDQALRLKPAFADAHNNRAGVLLLRGDLKAGFAEFEYRWDRSNAPRRPLNLPLPVWRGEPLQGRRVLVYDEQGLGDLMQFCRYLPMLTATGAEVSFYSRSNMFRLLSSMPGVPRLLDRVEAGEAYDYQIALMSLPHMFGTELDTVPAPVPYLAADPQLVGAWAERLAAAETGTATRPYRIGICWHGNPKINLERNIPLACFGALAGLPGVRVISLMKDLGAEAEATAAALGIERLGKDFDQGPDSFVDTAAVMANLDLVVTSDTSIAHLGGALRRPVFLALKQIPDWRWMAAGDGSPWYPSMRIFRQKEKGAWQSVIDDIAEAVRADMARRASATQAQVAIPGAVGELIDKITILEIKAANIRDRQKRANVAYELSLLQSLKAEHDFAGPDLDAVMRELKQTNARLWQVEDELRLHEEACDFGPDFVALARSVYKLNDRRAELKKKINLLCNSAIVEEKSYGA